MTSPLEVIRRFTDPIPARTRTHPVRNGIIVVALGVFLMFAAVTGLIRVFGGGQEVRAEFRAVNQVDDQTPVRIRGVNVGKVAKIEAGNSPQRRSRLVMNITQKDVVVHRDARAQIRWRTILGGEMYIDLDPGSPQEEELGEGTIPVERTGSQVELDQVLQPYDGGTEQAQRDLFRGLADGFGDPESAGRAIDTLPALDTVRRGVEPVRGRDSDDLRRLVASTATTVDALGEDTRSLQDLVTGADRTFAATRQRREELGELLELSPSTLDSTRTTMTRLRTTLGRLDPLVADLRPGVRRIAPATRAATPALEQARRFLRGSRPLLRDARPALTSLTGTSDAGVPLIERLNPTLARLDRETLPFLRVRDEETRLRLYEAIGPTFASLGNAGAEFDAEGIRFRLSTPFGSTSAATLVQAGFVRQCRLTVRPSRRSSCGPLAEVMAQGYFGRGRQR
jgi:virulence factor Mce-like protein